MDKFTDEQIRSILCIAIQSEVLILTVRDGTAAGLKESITDYIYHNGMGDMMFRSQSERGKILFKGAFHSISVMSADWWNDRKCADIYVFDGAVYVTNSCIKDIKHIKEKPRPVTEIWSE